MLQLHFEVDVSCDFSNVNTARTHDALINMDENDYLHACLLIQLQIFFKDILSENNVKTEDNLIDIGSEPVHWINLKDAKNNKTS